MPILVINPDGSRSRHYRTHEIAPGSVVEMAAGAMRNTITSSSQETVVDIAQVTKYINRLVAQFNPQARLPEDLDEDGFIPALALMVALLCGPEEDGKVVNNSTADAVANAPVLQMGLRQRTRQRPRNRTIYRNEAQDIADARRALGVRPPASRA